jgi:hypothetical protein
MQKKVHKVKHTNYLQDRIQVQVTPVNSIITKEETSGGG